MGKFLKILGIIFLILIVAIVVGLFYGHSKGNEKMQEFYDIIATNDPNALLVECSPELKATIDPPVLKLWMKGFNDALGKYEGLSGSDFSINYNSTNGMEVLTINGTAKFSKGEAKTFIEKVNGKISSLKVESPQFKGDSWLTEPPLDFYKDKAVKLLTLMTDNPPKIDQARDMLPDKLKKQLQTEATKKSMEKFLDICGSRKSIEMIDSKFVTSDDEGNRAMTLFFKYTGQKKSCDAYVKFTFEKLGSVVRAFLIPSSPIETNDTSAAPDDAIPTEKLTALFGAIESEKPSELIDLCIPELSREFDTPILLAWMKAFNSSMGKYESLDKNNFSVKKQVKGKDTLLTVEGKIKCEQGPVDLSVRYLNDKIIGFDITSEKITASKWFEDVDMSFCKAKGEKFLRYLVDGQTNQAGAMMMDKLRSQFSKEQIETAMQNFVSKYGKPESITATNTELKDVPNSKSIKIDYDYAGQTANCKAYVRFIIMGLKTEVIGFQIPM